MKVLTKGRKIISKDGTIKFTPSNEIAFKILKNENSSVNFDDLLQDVVLSIFEHIQNGTITIDYDNLLIDGDEMSRIAIFNTVQNKLYSLQEKHAKHLYNITYVENENGEQIENDTQMYTLAQRAYDLSINNLEYNDLINRLKINLTSDEKEVLKSCFESKQVERNYTTNGKQAKHFVTRQLTLQEKSEYTNLTIQNIRTATNNIQVKASKYLLDNNMSKSYIEKVVLSKIK